MPNKKLIKFEDLKKLIPLSRSTVWRRIQQGTFPKSIDLGGGTKNSAKAWIEDDILTWIERQQAASQLNLNKVN